MLPYIFQACVIDIRRLSMKTKTKDVTSMSLLNMASKWKGFRYQSIHIQITYKSLLSIASKWKGFLSSGIPFLFEHATISVHSRWILLTVLHLMDKYMHHLHILCCFDLFELKFNQTNRCDDWYVRRITITCIVQRI